MLSKNGGGLEINAGEDSKPKYSNIMSVRKRRSPDLGSDEVIVFDSGKESC